MQQNTVFPIIAAQCAGKIEGSTKECHRRNSCYRYTSIGIVPSTPWLPKYEYMCIVQDSFFHDVAEISIKPIQESVMTTSPYKSNGETVAELNFEKTLNVELNYAVSDGKVSCVWVGDSEDYSSITPYSQIMFELARAHFENTEEYQAASALERESEHQQLQGEYFASCM